MTNNELLSELKSVSGKAVSEVAKKVGCHRHTVRNFLSGKFKSDKGVLIQKEAKALIRNKKAAANIKAELDRTKIEQKISLLRQLMEKAQEQ